MCPRRSHKLEPLIRLTSIKRKFKWAQVEQDAFEEIQRNVARDNLLTYPGFIETFKTHTDAISFQWGADIIQKVKLIAFWSRKLTGAQQWYTVTEREIIIIVENLKEFRNILLGHKLIIYTDHKVLPVRILIPTYY